MVAKGGEICEILIRDVEYFIYFRREEFPAST